MDVRVWGVVEDRLIEVRAEPAGQGDGLRVEGLPPGRARTTRDRVRAALVNSGVVREAPDVTLCVVPALVEGCRRAELDVALALAAVSRGGVLGDGLAWILAEGRLGLDGRVWGPEQAGTAMPLEEVVGALVTGVV